MHPRSRYSPFRKARIHPITKCQLRYTDSEKQIFYRAVQRLGDFIIYEHDHAPIDFHGHICIRMRIGT